MPVDTAFDLYKEVNDAVWLADNNADWARLGNDRITQFDGSTTAANILIASTHSSEYRRFDRNNSKYQRCKDCAHSFTFLLILSPISLNSS